MKFKSVCQRPPTQVPTTPQLLGLPTYSPQNGWQMGGEFRCLHTHHRIPARGIVSEFSPVWAVIIKPITPGIMASMSFTSDLAVTSKATNSPTLHPPNQIFVVILSCGIVICRPPHSHLWLVVICCYEPSLAPTAVFAHLSSSVRLLLVVARRHAFSTPDDGLVFVISPSLHPLLLLSTLLPPPPFSLFFVDCCLLLPLPLPPPPLLVIDAATCCRCRHRLPVSPSPDGCCFCRQCGLYFRGCCHLRAVMVMTCCSLKVYFSRHST